MAAAFRVVSTPAFEREFRKASRGKAELVEALEELIAILGEDPQNRGGRYQIKKLAGLKPGEGQWRIRRREYRLRCDTLDKEVVLHSFRHRKEAY